MPKHFKRRSTRKPISNALRKYVQQTISGNIETKFANHPYNLTAIPWGTSGGLEVSLSAVAQGDSQITRSGNQIFVTGIHSRLWLSLGDSTNIVRVIMYIPRNSVSDTLGAGTVTIHTAIDVDRFTILMDKTVFLNADTPYKMINLGKKFNKGARKGIRVQFDGSAVTDLASNPIKLYFVSDSSASAHPALNGNIKCYFKDA